MIEPKNVPCCHDSASVTSGTTDARRPPNRMAEMGTPLGFSQSGDTTGHWRMGVVKRALGCAALRPLVGVHGRRSQSMRCAGGVAVMSSHHTSPSGVMAQLVKMELRRTCAWRWGSTSRSSRRHAEHAGLRIDGVEPAVGAELHPRDVVADALDLPAGKRRVEHGEVRLAAGRGNAAAM
jgi:hypothetical protein